MAEQPITLTSMSVTNFQGIAEAKVTFTGGTVYISGTNGAGKTSFLAAVATLFFGVNYAGAVPLKSGTKRGEIRGTLSNGLTCRMGITENGLTALTITDATGLTKGTPRAILNKLIGSLAFDPLRFITELSAKQQIEQLKTICGLDFTALDAERAELYGRRTDVNREAKSADAAFVAAPAWDTTAPAHEIDVADLMSRLTAARDHNAAIDRQDRDIRSGEVAIKSVRQRIANLEGELDAERKLLDTYCVGMNDRLDIFNAATKLDATAIESEIANSGAQNRKRTNNAHRDTLMERATKWQKESAHLSAEIDAIDLVKSERLTGAKMPIDGLSFSDDYVTWNGTPLAQASTREQMEVSFAICASLNPTLRAVIVPHGSLITPSNRPHFEALAERYGMQPLVELADESGEVPGIVISEGRVVRADNQTAMPTDSAVTLALDQLKKPASVSPAMTDGPFA